MEVCRCEGGHIAGWDLLTMKRDDSFGTSCEVLLQNLFIDEGFRKVGCLSLGAGESGGDPFTKISPLPVLLWS